MLPFGGQAANQALEDAGALGTVLNGLENARELPDRLQRFEDIRKPRATVIQILSSVRVGLEKTLEARLQPYREEEDIPTTFQERIDHAYGYDLIKDCRRRLDMQ